MSVRLYFLRGGAVMTIHLPLLGDVIVFAPARKKVLGMWKVARLKMLLLSISNLRYAPSQRRVMALSRILSCANLFLVVSSAWAMDIVRAVRLHPVNPFFV